MYLLGYDFNIVKSNKFHTSTAITDPFLAFSEGLAEHLEIIVKDMEKDFDWKSEFWDYAYDANAWLCSRDEQLRYFGAINNRFIYHTAFPYEEDFKETYNHLHLAHITSSAFTPEKLKNGSQMMASEGVISSIFYRISRDELFKNTFLDNQFYKQFGVDKKDVTPFMNLYLKILYSISKINLKNSTMMTAFIQSYGEQFPDEKEELYEIFLKVTHYATVSHYAVEVFENLYRMGKQGEIEAFKKVYLAAKELKNNMFEKIYSGELALDNALTPELWIETDEYITPIPWEPDKKVKYRIDINTATEIDFMAVNKMTLEQAIKLVQIRESQNGFKSLDEFHEIMKNI